MISFTASLPLSTYQKILEVSDAEKIKKREAAAYLISRGYSHNHIDEGDKIEQRFYREKGWTIVTSLSLPEPIYNMVLELSDAAHSARSTIITYMIETGYEVWKQEKADRARKNEGKEVKI